MSTKNNAIDDRYQYSVLLVPASTKLYFLQCGHYLFVLIVFKVLIMPGPALLSMYLLTEEN